VSFCSVVVLAARNKYCVITGVSGIVLAIAPIAEETHIPQINTSGQNPDIANTGPFTITLINLAGTETRAMASYTYDVLGLKRVATIHSNAAAGSGAARQFRESFEKLGGSVVSQNSYDDTKTDYRAQITRTFANNPEAVFVPGVSANIARVIKQAHELGHQTQWLSYSGFEGPEIAAVAGSAANGTIFTSSELASSQTSDFAERYERRYGSKPELYASTAYDAIKAISRAYQSGARTSEALVATLTSGDFAYEGVTGKFTIDATGVVSKPVLFKVYSDGKFGRAPRHPDR